MKKQAFSLVELSIVLVILGLLVGGVLAGQSLIHAAELRAVATEYDKYTTALRSFRDKYFALPGDMTNATAFWGKDTTSSAACATQPGNAATPGTCNGNGDGVLSTYALTNEDYRAWQQLAMAGLIEGSYAGTISSGLVTPVIGTDIPKSKVAGSAGWTFTALSRNSSTEIGPYSDVANVFSDYLFLGVNTKTNNWANQFFLKPEDVWNIDTKMDDGLPGTGIVNAGRLSVASGVGGSGQCTTTNVSSTAAYDFSNSAPQCDIAFLVPK